MVKVKLTKTELKAQTDALKRFQRFLPLLQLKKQQLRAYVVLRDMQEAQEIYGYLPEDLQFYIAGKMGIPIAEVSGVVSFYSFFTTKKRGKHTIRVCQGTACYVRGGKRLVEAIKDELDVDVGDTTEDGLFTFEIARCIGACGLAPAIMIDDDVYKQMTPQKLHILLRKYREKEREAAEAEGGAAS